MNADLQPIPIVLGAMFAALPVRLSQAPHPRTTPEAAAAPHVQVSFLKATTGSMNYPLPAGVDLSRFSSIVIWCELTSNAYAAATLER